MFRAGAPPVNQRIGAVAVLRQPGVKQTRSGTIVVRCAADVTERSFQRDRL
jgi:hypothetical protein